MHVISPKKFRAFCIIHPRARNSMEAWFRVAFKAKWTSFHDVRNDYAHADQYGQYVIFNISGNKYRLIASIHYNRGKLFVLHVLTHAEYTRGDWKNE